MASSARLWAALWCGLAAAVGIVVAVAVYTAPDRAAQREQQVRQLGNIAAIQRKVLSSRYQDADGDLLADAPTDPAQRIDPDVLVLACYRGDRDDMAPVEWDALRAHLAHRTAKQVDLRPYVNSANDVAAVASGKTHVLAVHGADVPYLVNNAGFIPIAALGDAASPIGNDLVIATMPNSGIHRLEDIKGKTLTCTRPDSITGCRAAVAALFQEARLRATIDYAIQYSFTQRASIRGLVAGQFEVVAISHEKLRATSARGAVRASDYRLIYEAPIVPRRVVGCIHCLDRRLANDVMTALLSFGDAANREETRTKALRFHGVDYKRDFEFERLMDDCFQPRFGQTLSSE